MESTPSNNGADEAAAASAELRLAVTMNGGVSLAVWIGGATAELLELVRSGETSSARSGYTDLCSLIDSKVTVDVLSGASAGGVNGAALAIALSTDLETLEVLRSVWLNQGDIEQLLRSATTKNVPSLLDGDFFADQLTETFQQLACAPELPRIERTRQTERIAPATWPTLFMSATMLSGVTQHLRDDAGAQIIDTRSDAYLEFTSEHFKSAGNATNRRTSPLWGRIGTAARASSSFPGAFQPTWVDFSESDDSLRENFHPTPSKDAKGAWIVDGGVLNNKPIESALEKILRQKATTAVRRVMLYVVPDPGVGAVNWTDKQEKEPSITSTLLQSGFTIPRQESISAEIAQLRAHNDDARRAAALRLRIAADAGAQIVPAARPFAEAFRESQAIASARRSLDRMLAALAEAGKLQRNTADRHSDSPAASLKLPQDTILAALERERRARFPHDYLPDGPVSTHGELDGTTSYWGYGVGSAEYMATIVIEMAQTLLHAIPVPAPPDLGDVISQIQAAQIVAHDLLGTVRVTAKPDMIWWNGVADSLLALTDVAEAERWAKDFYAGKTASDKRERFQKVGDLALQSALHLVSLRNSAAKLSSWIGPIENALVPASTHHSIDLVLRALRGLTTPPEGWTHGSDEWTLRQVLALELIHVATTGTEPPGQIVELVQISAEASQYVSRRTTYAPSEKLTGIGLAHFGAFYKSSWRANDWMWGCLDGSARLVETAVNLERLQQVWHKNRTEYLAALCTAATNSRNESIRSFLQAEWFELRSRSNSRLEAEIDRVCAGTADPAYPDLDELRETRRLIARRRQLEVLHRELPVVFREVVSNQHADGLEQSASESFLIEAAAAFGLDSRTRRKQGARFRTHSAPESPLKGEGPIPATASTVDVERMISAFEQLQIGSERVTDEIGTDRFTEIASRVAAVGTTAARQAAPGKALTGALSALRGLALTLHLVTSIATKRSATSGFAQQLLLAAFAAGAALLSIVVFGGGGAAVALSTVGLILISIPLLVAARRLGLRLFGIAVVVLTGAVLAAWNIESILNRFDIYTSSEDGTRTGAGQQTTGSDTNGVADWIVDRRSSLTIVVLVFAFLLLGLLTFQSRWAEKRYRKRRAKRIAQLVNANEQNQTQPAAYRTRSQDRRNDQGTPVSEFSEPAEPEEPSSL